MSDNNLKRNIPSEFINRELISEFNWPDFAKQTEFLNLIKWRTDWKGNNLRWPVVTNENLDVKSGEYFSRGELRGATSNISYDNASSVATPASPSAANADSPPQGPIEGVMFEIEQPAVLTCPLIFTDRDFIEANSVHRTRGLSPIIPQKIKNARKYMQKVLAFLIASGGNFSRMTKNTLFDPVTKEQTYFVSNLNRFQVNMALWMGSKDRNSHAHHKTMAPYRVKEINYHTRGIKLKRMDGGPLPDESAEIDVAAEIVFYYYTRDLGAGNRSEANIIKYYPTSILNAIENAAALRAPATLHGITKTDYRTTQAINLATHDLVDEEFTNTAARGQPANLVYHTIDTGANEKNNLLHILFNGFMYMLELHDTMPTMALLSRRVAGVIKYLASNARGWDLIAVNNNAQGQTQSFIIQGKGFHNLRCQVIDSFPDDKMAIINPDEWEFITNGGIRLPQKDVLGSIAEQFVIERTQTGVRYITDLAIYYQLRCLKEPFRNMLIYQIPTQQIYDFYGTV